MWALPDPGGAFRRWVRLLGTGGVAVLIEGRWSTGAGLTAGALRGLVEEHAAALTVVPLDDARLWGRAISDERYALVLRTRSTEDQTDQR